MVYMHFKEIFRLDFLLFRSSFFGRNKKRWNLRERLKMTLIKNKHLRDGRGRQG